VIDQEEEVILRGGEKLTGSMIGRRRIAPTWAVGEAWERFSREKEEVVHHPFHCVSIALPIDGSADAQISIKGTETGYLVEGLASVHTGVGVTWEEGLEAWVEPEEVVGSIVRGEVEEDECCDDSDDKNIVFELLPKIEK